MRDNTLDKKVTKRVLAYAIVGGMLPVICFAALMLMAAVDIALFNTLVQSFSFIYGLCVALFIFAALVAYKKESNVYQKLYAIGFLLLGTIAGYGILAWVILSTFMD